MPTQTYFCALHAEMFEISVPFSVKHPPKNAICPLDPLEVDLTFQKETPNPHMGAWRPSAANFIVKEGTGAFKRSPINHD